MNLELQKIKRHGRMILKSGSAVFIKDFLNNKCNSGPSLLFRLRKNIHYYLCGYFFLSFLKSFKYSLIIFCGSADVSYCFIRPIIFIEFAEPTKNRILEPLQQQSLIRKKYGVRSFSIVIDQSSQCNLPVDMPWIWI